MEAVYPFLDGYRRAFDAFDADAVAAHYHAPCLLIEPGRVFALRTRDDVRANMRALVEQYRAAGYRGVAIAHHEVRALGSGLALATVDWELELARGKTRFTNTYELVQIDARWRIAVSTVHGAVRPGSRS